MFKFHPLYLGSPVYIHGGEFQVFYRLHSIPTIGFTLKFQDQTFVYSSDHQADPGVQKQLLDDGVISQDRYEELKSFPWESKVIYHESGIAPLHTPITYLNSLPEDIQKRTVVYHIAAKDFPQETDLTLATFGMENTLYFETSPPSYEQSYKTLAALKHLDFFESPPVEKVQEFVSIVEEEHFKKSEVVIRQGSIGDKFYLIVSGNVAVKSDHLVSDIIFSEFEYFGEVALLTDRPRTADIVAATDVIALTIEKSKFLSFIAGTGFEQTLHRLIRNRSEETWNVMSTSSVFAPLTTYQRTWLESILESVEYTGVGTLIEEGYPLEAVYIVRDGEVKVTKGEEEVTTLSRGDFIGAMHKIQRGEVAEFTFSYNGDLRLFSISREKVLEFMEHNPGLGMKLAYQFSERQ